MTEWVLEHPDLDEAAETPPDETIVPASDRAPFHAIHRRRRSGLLVAAIASVVIHATLVTVTAWAITNRLILQKVPTLGSRGEMAEAGLTDDPGISALSSTDLPEAPTAVTAASAAPAAIDEIEEASATIPDTFTASAEPPRSEPPPLIGLSESSISLPEKRPTKHQLPDAAQPEISSTEGTTSPSDGASAAVAGTAAASSGVTESGVGTAPFTPPHPTGRGAGLSGRRGSRGLDSRGLPIPDYPRESRRLKEAGTVMLQVAVGPDGCVESVLVLTSSGFPRLDQAAAMAIREAKFTPALLGGRAVGGTVTVPYRFRLD